MARAVTIVSSGGVPVTNLASLTGLGVPMTPIDAGGVPVTLVNSGGQPVVFVNNDGTLWNDVSGIVLAAGGALYDPSDLTSLYQSRTGGSTGADGQFVGIMLDKSYMGGRTAAAFIAGQAELASDSAWVLQSPSQASSLPVAGLITWSPTLGAPGWFGGVIAVTSGNWYAITLTPQSVSGGTYFWRLDPTGFTSGGYFSATNPSIGTQITVVIRATSATLYFSLGQSAGQTITANGFSVKEIPGFHALAPTDAARPLLTVSGGLAYLTADGVDDWMQVFPTLNLGTAWWHVGGWRGDANADYAFTTRNSGYQDAMRQTFGEWTYWNEAQTGNGTIIASGAATSVAVVSLEFTTSSLQGRYNGVSGTPFDPYLSADAAGLALFSGANTSASSTLAGRFYGGAFAPGTISTTDRATVERYAAQLAGVTL